MNPIALTIMGLGVMLIAFSTCLRVIMDETAPAPPAQKTQQPVIRTSNKARHMRHGAQRRTR